MAKNFLFHISVFQITSILVFLFEPYKMKFSYTVLGGGLWFTYLNKVYDWFEERLEIQAIADDITSKYVPPHVNIFYCLGRITLTCFLVQVATGFAMTFYYRLTVTVAFAYVQYIMTEANFGWLIPRSMNLQNPSNWIWFNPGSVDIPSFPTPSIFNFPFYFIENILWFAVILRWITWIDLAIMEFLVFLLYWITWNFTELRLWNTYYESRRFYTQIGICSKTNK